MICLDMFLKYEEYCMLTVKEVSYVPQYYLYSSDNILTIQFIVLLFHINEGWSLQHAWMVWLHFSI